MTESLTGIVSSLNYVNPSMEAGQTTRIHQNKVTFIIQRTLKLWREFLSSSACMVPHKNNSLAVFQPILYCLLLLGFHFNSHL